MTGNQNPSITVEWKPDGQGDTDIDTNIDCTGDQLWDAITIIILCHLEEAGFAESAAARLAFGAVRHAQRYLDLKIGGH